MEIIISSPKSVTVDGVHFGAVADSIANNPTLASGIQIALEQWHATLLSEHSAVIAAKDAQHLEAIASKDTEIAVIRSEHEMSITSAQAHAQSCSNRCSEAIAELEETRTFAAGIISQANAVLADNSRDLQSKVVTLAQLVREAAKPSTQRKREALEAEIAAKQRELNEISATV